MARPRHCLSATHGWPSLNNSQRSSPTLYTSVFSVARQEASRQGGTGKERWRIEGGRDGGNKGGREGAVVVVLAAAAVRQGRGQGE